MNNDWLEDEITGEFQSVPRPDSLLLETNQAIRKIESHWEPREESRIRDLEESRIRDLDVGEILSGSLKGAVVSVGCFLVLLTWLEFWTVGGWLATLVLLLPFAVTAPLLRYSLHLDYVANLLGALLSSSLIAAFFILGYAGWFNLVLLGCVGLIAVLLSFLLCLLKKPARDWQRALGAFLVLLTTSLAFAGGDPLNDEKQFGPLHRKWIFRSIDNLVGELHAAAAQKDQHAAARIARDAVPWIGCYHRCK